MPSKGVGVCRLDLVPPECRLPSPLSLRRRCELSQCSYATVRLRFSASAASPAPRRSAVEGADDNAPTETGARRVQVEAVG